MNFFVTNSMVQNLFDKLIVTKLVKEKPALFFGTGRFITVFTKTRHDVILPPTPGLSQWSLPFGPPNQNSVNTSPLPDPYYMSRPPHPP
jgi:hypothetical protein